MKKSYLITLCLLVFLLVANDATAQRRKGRGKRRGSITVPALYKVDSDGDGVPDVRDQCRDTPKGYKVDKFGCPYPKDRDGDGVLDKDDKCVTVPGPKSNHGCPEISR